MKERIEGARPMMDMMAKKIFSNTSVTAQFIRDIFDLPVESVKILESTQIHEFYLDEFPYSTHIDVLAELDDHTQIIIEIQVALQIDFIKRLRNTNICDTNQCQYNLWDNWLVHKTV